MSEEQTVDQTVVDSLTDPAEKPKTDPGLPESLRKLVVDGEEIVVEDPEKLKALAQKGVAFEKRYNEAAQKLSDAEKSVETVKALRKWREDGDVEAYKGALAYLGYSTEDIDAMTAGYNEQTTETTTTTGDNAAWEREKAGLEKQIRELRDLVDRSESNRIQNLIREDLSGNDYIKEVLGSRGEDQSSAVMEFLTDKASEAARQFVRGLDDYHPSMDREIAGHAAKAAVEQARKLGLSAPTHLGRGGGPGGPGEVEIEPPKMPPLEKASVADVKKFVQAHLTNALEDRRRRF